MYLAMIDLARDQLATQLQSADTLDLKSVGVLGAALALVMTLLLLRADDPAAVGWWWWLPLPAFTLPGAFLVFPLLPSRESHRFTQGPSLPGFLAGASEVQGGATTLEGTLAVMIRDLHQSWLNNDRLLARETEAFWRGAALFGIVSLCSIGLYAWGLS